jgi:hypothetical protein
MRLYPTLAVLLALLTPAAAGAQAPTPPLTLALRFQPHLFFDRGERWRPTDVDAFLAEPGHQFCTTSALPDVCVPFVSPAQLTVPDSYLDLRGTRLDGVDATSPDLATCPRSLPTLLECDLGGRSVIYAHVTQGATRTAIDYWWFMRFNNFSIDLHEGDWEGVTVITDAAGKRVRAVDYAAHASVWRYRDGVARLDGGRHPRVYVARGGHASYPRPCRALCHQTSSALPEGRFDGRRAWVANVPATCAGRCVRLLPQDAAGAPASWNAWNGRWGVVRSALFAPPLTPAFQDRYRNPFAAGHTGRRRF